MESEEYLGKFSVASKVNGEHRLYYIGLERKNADELISTSQDGIARHQSSANPTIPFDTEEVNTQNEKYSFDDPLYEKRG